jgi:hypothetical protein
MPTLEVMRRGSSNLFLASVVAVLLVAVPIAYACLPYEDTLAMPAKLLLLIGTILIRPLDAAPDLPVLVFVNWAFYTLLLWPIVGIFRGSRSA